METSDAFRRYSATVLVPLAAAVAMGLRYQLATGVSVALLIALALLPVWASRLARYRGMVALTALGVLAALSGAVLTWLDPVRAKPSGLIQASTLSLLAILTTVGVLLWARDEIGPHRMAAAYGAGLVLNAAISGLNSANPWKFSLSLPVAILVLGLMAQKGKWQHELVALAVLGGVSLFSDSRSLTALLVLTGVLVLWQRRAQGVERRRARPWSTLLLVAAVAFSVFQLVQAAVLDGALGEAAAQRSQRQIETSGSVLVGGRPEMGAAIALIADRVQGYGSGVLPTSNDVWLAKSGMATLFYDPNNGYVDNYMFGQGFEVHSVLGDLWLRYGLAGAALALAMVGYCLYSSAVRVSTRTASALSLLLSMMAAWDLLFGPILSASRGLALALALAALTAVPRPPALGEGPQAAFARDQPLRRRDFLSRP